MIWNITKMTQKMIKRQDTVKRFNVNSNGMPEGRRRAGRKRGRLGIPLNR